MDTGSQIILGVGVFGCMSLLGCHDVCPKELPLDTQIAFLRRRMVRMSFS